MKKRELTEALFVLNSLQNENYDGASHDLAPAQERVRLALADHPPERGLTRLAIECAPQVRELRNRLDDPSNYGPGGGSRLARAAAMRRDVLALMERRDAAARSLGFSGYVDAVLTADGITETRLRELLEGYLREHRPLVSSRAQAGIALEDWFSWLSELGRLDRTYDPVPLLGAFAGRLGLEPVLSRIELRLSDSFCFASRTKEEIYMQVSPVKDADSWCTLFHEFGHACEYALIPEEDIPWLTPPVDEAVAVLFENAAIRLLAGEPLRGRAMESRHMEYTRTCVSGLFELDLWRDRTDPESMYERRYERLGVRVEPAAWPLDSFRSIDPMAIFAYTVGQSLADGLTDEKLASVLPETAIHAADMTFCELIDKLE